MNERFSEYVVAYDVADDKERSRVEKTLKGYGFRKQKSVFECRLGKSGLRNLVNQLEKLNLKTGFVKIYRLESAFKTKTLGVCPDKEKDEFDDGAAFII